VCSRRRVVTNALTAIGGMCRICSLMFESYFVYSFQPHELFLGFWSVLANAAGRTGNCYTAASPVRDHGCKSSAKGSGVSPVNIP
jgi:hypothetical protein